MRLKQGLGSLTLLIGSAFLLALAEGQERPSLTPEQEARVAKLKQMTPDKIAPMVVFLASDKASQVTGQIFAVRNNEIFLMSQPRPIRSVHRGEGWTPETIAEHALPALQADLYSLDVSADVFSWDPV